MTSRRRDPESPPAVSRHEACVSCRADAGRGDWTLARGAGMADERSPAQAHAAPEPDVYLAEQVRQALIQDPRVNELYVQVTVTGRDVYLRGTVATPERQRAIAAVAGEILPDREIHNQTKVGAYPEPGVDETEHLG